MQVFYEHEKRSALLKLVPRLNPAGNRHRLLEIVLAGMQSTPKKGYRELKAELLDYLSEEKIGVGSMVPIVAFGAGKTGGGGGGRGSGPSPMDVDAATKGRVVVVGRLLSPRDTGHGSGLIPGRPVRGGGSCPARGP